MAVETVEYSLLKSEIRNIFLISNSVLYIHVYSIFLFILKLRQYAVIERIICFPMCSWQSYCIRDFLMNK